jgi:hypothetical protein
MVGSMRCYALEGTRTPIALRPLVPETSASTNSATRATACIESRKFLFVRTAMPPC